jgi:hypothetical protein
MENTSACIHRLLEGNIREFTFTFTEASRRAVDDMVEILEQLQIEAANGDRGDHSIPSLVDSTVGLQPLNYAFLKVKPLISKYPLMRRARVAMLVSPTPLLKTIDMIMRSVAPVRFYTADQREAALAWLREASKPIQPSTHSLELPPK